jgi:hypothetical protein
MLAEAQVVLEAHTLGKASKLHNLAAEAGNKPGFDLTKLAAA